MDKPKFAIPLGLSLLDACLQGLATRDNLEDYVEHWHTHSEATGELHEFLGLTKFEYGKLLLHSDSFLDEVLYCRQHGKDLEAVWTPERLDDLGFLLLEIPCIKGWVWEQKDLEDEDIDALLTKLGGLIEQKNRITGWDQDIRYLYSTDERHGRFVLGFPGDSSGTVDAGGNALQIGDTISCAGEDGKRWKRMILQCADSSPTLEQEWLLKHDARLETPYNDAMKESMANTGIRMELRSCRADYILQQRAAQATGLANFPVYWGTPQSAWDRGERKLLQASEKANDLCADRINGGTHESMHYPLRKTLAQELVQSFGMERSQYVLASCIRSHEGDGRIARDIHLWAEHFLDGKSPWRWYSTTNPGVINMLCKDLLKLDQRAEQAITEVLASIAPASLTEAQQTLLRNSAWAEEPLRQAAETVLQTYQEQEGPAQGAVVLG